MAIQENISLKNYNSFGIAANARLFATFDSIADLSELVTQQPKTPMMVLGGGTNILLTKDFDGLVLKNAIKGIEKLREDDDFVYVQAGAGENWHQFVLHCIQNNWAGVENLSLIPGNIGASPMQNIGAYGAEIKDVFHELKAWHLREKCNYTFTLKDCEFGYRDSVFKGKYRDQFVILNVTYRLNKKPVFNTRYGAIESELDQMKVKGLSIAAISEAVTRIRSSKLPDPVKIGNAGSFFKNPTVPRHEFVQLKQQFPGIIGFDQPGDNVKLAAAWLIEQCGWKGYRKGDAGCHENQALVLVNYGNATGQEIDELGKEIATSVQARFNIILEKEVNIV